MAPIAVTTRTPRMLGVLALVALIGGPVAGTACAMWCVPDSALGRAAGAAAAGVAAHHCQPATPVVASVAATGCDTHRTTETKLHATLTAPRSDTHNPIALRTTVSHRAAMTLSAALQSSAIHGPPPDSSQTAGSRALVLRI